MEESTICYMGPPHSGQIRELQIRQQATVETALIIRRQVFLVVHEFLLHGALEALAAGVPLRAARASVAVAPALLFGIFVQDAGELAAVIAQHLPDGAREDRFDRLAKRVAWRLLMPLVAKAKRKRLA